MNTKHVILALLTVLGSFTTQGKRGRLLEESLEFHGDPIGKMISGDETTYIFQCGDRMIREVYNTDNLCIESSCNAQNHQAEKEAVPSPITTAIPLPEPPTEPKKYSSLWLFALLLLSLVSGLAILFVTKLILRRNAAQEEKNEDNTSPTGLCFKEASMRLSMNEMCFLRALHTAVHEFYLVTYQEPVEQIINSLRNSCPAHESILKLTERVIADFVLHSVDGGTISAIVLLHDAGSKDQKKIRRMNYIRRTFEGTEIKVVIFPANYHYDPENIKETLRKFDVPLNTHSSAA